MSVKVRFAPSPTGKLHVGNVRTALVNWLFAKGQGGSFVLRIDDTDLARSTQEFEDGIETDLTWLGLVWDERYNQSKRFDRYEEAAERLKASGRLYACYETADELDRRRKVQLSRGLPPIYDRAALLLTDAEKAAFEAEGRRPHWRFKLEGKRVAWEDLARGHAEVDTASMSDPVLIREDGLFLYTLPSVVDDIDMDITHIIRGEDHVTNTGAQIEIFEALDAKVPGFAHMPLLVGADGAALSKRLGSLSISDMRDQGYEPIAITSHLGKIGTSDNLEIAASVEALGQSFAFSKMGRSPARYDTADLDRLNAQALHGLTYAEAQPRLTALGVDLGEGFWEAVKPNLNKFADVADMARIVTGPVTPVIEDPAFAAAALEVLPDVIDTGAWSAWTTVVKEKTGAKGKGLFMPLRLALTGQAHGPDMAAMAPLIGRDAIVRRLKGEAS
ncbi:MULTISPECIES: glutamate--tRNA ligase [unclassified Brevundimonas]|uniref:glutamate--tRNA ligase n=1 Tax=unclassified Brevundimonas TaxID=2622653 RepID=UPI000CFB7C8B|nr:MULTISPECIES: glutamate--tRNA ligase [unclassified Brevundimonas]PRA34476.1 glutamate--tRNA ligase [Brevundimonas sp. MYb27]PQZ84177.1 glutamate--tRNA ligase [Brevundimonas sp. MYb31]PRB17850.1 glutamate--tRNA ligase [Brevundimonas sp. MYb52]PRB38221.1 glutamate--tRNA ligase [Brevundimonas sp. MYb46]PRB55998.1 glutamate--tRNA ligase [Brevundimonas sp. MYb33]